MESGDWALVISGLVALSGLTGVLVQYARNRRDAAGAERDDARDDAKVYAEVSLSLLEPLREAKAELQARYDAMKAEFQGQIDTMRAEIVDLQKNVSALQLVNASLRSQASISDMRAKHFRGGAYRNYHQLMSLGQKPIFDPTKDFGDPPTQPTRTNGGDRE